MLGFSGRRRYRLWPSGLYSLADGCHSFHTVTIEPWRWKRYFRHQSWKPHTGSHSATTRKKTFGNRERTLVWKIGNHALRYCNTFLQIRQSKLSLCRIHWLMHLLICFVNNWGKSRKKTHPWCFGGMFVCIQRRSRSVDGCATFVLCTDSFFCVFC